MRIFVTGTGRCGTVTFSKACALCKNFTVGHETKTNTPDWSGHIDDLEYPDNHIEVSPQLIINIPRLKAKYPDSLWVYMIRMDRDASARSIINRVNVYSFSEFWYLNRVAPPLDIAYAIYDVTNSLCAALLYGAFRFYLEHAKEQWESVIKYMGLDIDFDESLKVWDTKYNATPT